MTSSYSKDFGKDKVVFVTKKDFAEPSKIELPPPPPQESVITDKGEINWNCPCLGNITTGPCGVNFREAFSCFHYSESEPKGKECVEAFHKMHECFKQYPTVYKPQIRSVEADDDDDEDGGGLNFGSLGSGNSADEESKEEVTANSQSASTISK